MEHPSCPLLEASCRLNQTILQDFIWPLNFPGLPGPGADKPPHSWAPLLFKMELEPSFRWKSHRNGTGICSEPPGVTLSPVYNELVKLVFKGRGGHSEVAGILQEGGRAHFVVGLLDLCSLSTLSFQLCPVYPDWTPHPQPQSGGSPNRPPIVGVCCPVYMKGPLAAPQRGKWGAWLIGPNMGLAGNDLANGFEIIVMFPLLHREGKGGGGRSGWERRGRQKV